MNFKKWLNSQENPNSQQDNYQLKPLSFDDMACTSREDASEWLAKYGKNTTKLGDRWTEEEFDKYSKLIVPMDI